MVVTAITVTRTAAKMRSRPRSCISSYYDSPWIQEVMPLPWPQPSRMTLPDLLMILPSPPYPLGERKEAARESLHQRC